MADEEPPGKRMKLESQISLTEAGFDSTMASDVGLIDCLGD